MTPEPSPAALLAFAQRLLAFTRPAEILECAAMELQRWLQADAAYVSYVPPRQSWERARHRAIAPLAGEANPASVSALFAVRRRTAASRGSVVIERSADSEVILDALSRGGVKATGLIAIAIQRRGNQLLAQLVLVSERSLAASACLPLDEVARLTATALENAERLAVALRDQERLLLLEAATAEAVWDWNLSNDEFWWGGGIRNLLGAGPSARSQSASKFERIDPEDLERVRESFARALQGNTSAWSDEYRLLRSDGTRVDVEDRAYFVRDAAGRCYRVFGALRDIGPLRQLLASEKASRQQAEAASRTKDEFLAMLGHELRNPLAPIMTALELMKMRDHETSEHERSIIERQAHHLVRLVDDLLDVSRITRGLIELKREVVKLGHVVTEAIEMSTPIIEKRGHRLHVDIPDELAVDVDPGRMAQVLSNLITNAAKYSEPGGSISVRATQRDGALDLIVEDTGIGISPTLLPHVFDLFVQEHQDTDRARGGLGLGLGIVRNLVILHGGTVRAESEGHGRGSRFTVHLPAVERATIPSRARALAPAATASHVLRVLVVDDNEDAVDLLARQLKTLGHEVEVAYDGPSALDVAGRFQPDLALLDIGLPVMDGYELARRLHKSWPDVRLVALTGYGQDADRSRAAHAGFAEHLVKPLTMDRLSGLLSAAESKLVGAQQELVNEYDDHRAR